MRNTLKTLAPFTLALLVACENRPVATAPDGSSVSGLTLLPAELPAAQAFASYEVALEAGGGTAPYAFALEGAGALPDGLALSSNGTLGGIPYQSGSFAIEIRVTDSATPPATASFARTLTVAQAQLQIVTAAVPEAIVGVPYSFDLQSEGGTAPTTWGLQASSALPAGLSLDAAGRLSGTPGETGTFEFAVTAEDSAGLQSSRGYALTVAASGALAILTESLPNGSVGAAYFQTLSASGGTEPYAWSAVAGSLPPGLSLSLEGALTGTPTAAGTFDFTVVAADSAAPGQSASASLSVTIIPPSGGTLAVTTPALPDAVVGAAYSATLAAGGGAQPYQWTLSSGAVPAGLALAPDGTIAGVPTTAGTALFTVEVRDASNPAQVASARLGITVLATSGSLHVTSASLPGGTLGVAYSAALDTAGGTAPFTWSLASGALPAGLSLGADGRLSGVPSAVGSFPLVLQVTDAATPANTAQKPFILEVATGPLSIVTVSLPKGVVGIAYAAQVQASGGQAPFSWRVAAGALPAGLSLDASTGALSGVPTTVSTATFTVQASDSSAPQKTAQAELTIAVTANSSGLVITTVSLPDAVQGVFYSYRFTAAGGTETYTWSLVNGTLPAGVTLASDGLLSGTPATSGAFSLTVRVHDVEQPPGQFNQPFTLDVREALRISSQSLPAAKVGTAYAANLVAAGGATPYAFALLSGSLPPGVTLSATGLLSGTPTAEGVYGFVAQVTDASAPRQITSASLSIAVSRALSLDTADLPEALVGIEYDAAPTASGGEPPYTWSVTSGALPSGIFLDASTGRLHGTPTAAGDAAFTLQVADLAGQTASRALSLKVTLPTSLVLATATVPGAAAGVAYSAAFSAAGGSPPYGWSVSAGALPPGLSLSASTGVISGIPVAPGASSFTVRVVDNSTPQQEATRAFTLAVTAPLTVATTALPPGITGAAYDAPLSATGGTAPYAWSVSGGALPQGLALDPISGRIAGTPTAAGSFGFSVRVTDASAPQQSASATLTIVVSPALAVTTASLADAAIGTAYAATLEATGGTRPYTWSMSSGALPPGLSLEPSTGKLSGTPTASGTFAFTATVSDASIPKQTASRGLSIVVRDSNALTITTTSLPPGVAGTAYAASLQAFGGTSPYTWAISAGGLPPGLWLDTATGALAGTLTATGTYTFTAQVSDTSTLRQTVARALSIAVVAPLAVATSALPGGVVGLDYAAALGASGGVPPLTWSVSSGALPAGLSLDALTGIVSGTPTAIGVATFTVAVADSSQPAPLSASAELSIAVVAPLAISTTWLPQARLQVTYAAALHATGGTTPYSWSISAGSLPPGLSLDAALGTIAGTPTTAGSWTFTATVRDASDPQRSASAELSITVVADLVITTADLPGGSVGAVYGATLTATGGTLPYTWAIVGGQDLPPGLSLDASSGAIAGTPTAAGSYTFNAQVSDASTPTLHANKSLTLAVAASGSLVITTHELPDGVRGSAYATTLSASGGTAPYTWSVSAGALPPGLSLEAASGAISGVPTAGGSYAVTLQVVDSAGTPAQATRAFTLRVADLLVVTTTSLPDARLHSPYSVTLTATGGTAPYTWSIATGTLPTGLALDPATGTIGGTPSQSGNRSFTVRVTDSAQPSQHADQALSLRVN